jgi:hypothetical protein
MNGKTIEDIADRVVEQVELADKLLDEQFEGMGPGLKAVDDQTFRALFLMRMSEHGPDFAKALDAKKPDGTDLIPGGRNALRRYMRIEQQMRVPEWEPEPYEEVSDAATGI